MWVCRKHTKSMSPCVGVDAGLECPVCKEDYKADESVRQLPCEHLFHNDCIVPWLEQVWATVCNQEKLSWNARPISYFFLGVSDKNKFFFFFKKTAANKVKKKLLDLNGALQF